MGTEPGFWELCSAGQFYFSRSWFARHEVLLAPPLWLPDFSWSPSRCGHSNQCSQSSTGGKNFAIMEPKWSVGCFEVLDVKHERDPYKKI